MNAIGVPALPQSPHVFFLGEERVKVKGARFGWGIVWMQWGEDDIANAAQLGSPREQQDSVSPPSPIVMKSEETDKT